MCKNLFMLFFWLASLWLDIIKIEGLTIHVHTWVLSRRLFSAYGTIGREGPMHLGNSYVRKRLTESDTQLPIELILYTYTVMIRYAHICTYDTYTVIYS